MHLDAGAHAEATNPTKRRPLAWAVRVNARVSTVEFMHISYALRVCPPDIESVVPHAETKTPSKHWRCLAAVGEYTALGPYELIEKCELHDLQGPADHLIGGMCRCWWLGAIHAARRPRCEPNDASLGVSFTKWPSTLACDATKAAKRIWVQRAPIRFRHGLRVRLTVIRKR